MLPQARFPREEAKVEICRQKSMWGGWPGDGLQWGVKEEAGRGEVGCHRAGLASP